MILSTVTDSRPASSGHGNLDFEYGSSYQGIEWVFLWLLSSRLKRIDDDDHYQPERFITYPFFPSILSLSQSPRFYSLHYLTNLYVSLSRHSNEDWWTNGLKDPEAPRGMFRLH